MFTVNGSMSGGGYYIFDEETKLYLRKDGTTDKWTGGFDAGWWTSKNAAETFLNDYLKKDETMFKVGDKVRYVKHINVFANKYPKEDGIYTVKSIGDTASMQVEGLIWHYDPDSFELVTEPMFKAGDKVRYVKHIDVFAYDYPLEEKNYTVLFCDKYNITLEEMVTRDDQFHWYYKPESFELVTEEEPKFIVGDRVRCINASDLDESFNTCPHHNNVYIVREAPYKTKHGGVFIRLEGLDGGWRIDRFELVPEEETVTHDVPWNSYDATDDLMDELNNGERSFREMIQDALQNAYDAGYVDGQDE